MPCTYPRPSTVPCQEGVCSGWFATAFSPTLAFARGSLQHVPDLKPAVPPDPISTELAAMGLTRRKPLWKEEGACSPSQGSKEAAEGPKGQDGPGESGEAGATKAKGKSGKAAPGGEEEDVNSAMAMRQRLFEAQRKRKVRHPSSSGICVHSSLAPGGCAESLRAIQYRIIQIPPQLHLSCHNLRVAGDACYTCRSSMHRRN